MFIFNVIKSIFNWIKQYFDEITLVVLSGFFFLVATNTQSGWLFFVIAFILGALLFNLITAYLNLRKLEIRRIFSYSVREDDKLKVTVKVRNNSRFPKFFLRLEDSFPSMHPDEEKPNLLIVQLPAGGQKTLTYERTAYKRGIYEFGPVEIKTSGLLGFVKLNRKRKIEESKLAILPRTLKILTPDLRSSFLSWGRGEKTYTFTGRSHDFIGIREYQPGQEIRFIHWPSTARHDKLMIKEFNEISVQSVSILLETYQGSEFGSGRETTVEYMIRAAADLLKGVRRGQYVYNLYYPGNGKWHSGTRMKPHEAELKMAEITPDAEKPLDEYLDDIINDIQPNQQLYIFKVQPIEDISRLKILANYKVDTSVVFFSPEYFTNVDGTPPPWFDYSSQVEELRKIGIKSFVYNRPPEKSEVEKNEKSEMIKDEIYK